MTVVTRRSLTFYWTFFLLAFAVSLRAQQVDLMAHAKPVALSGSADATTIFYDASGIPARYPSFNYVLTGSPVISLYGWQIPFTFIIGKQQNRFAQPFNQFGISPSYKWITLHAGYRNLDFSPFTLAGHTFLGAAVELTPHKFRLAFMYGQLNKATAPDTAQNLYFANFTYRRMGMALKLGYGTRDNFLELLALKAKDDAGSAKLSKGMTDTLGITPAENTVVGYNMRITLWKKHLTLESNGAASLYTNDIHAPRIQDSSFGNEVKQVSRFTNVTTSSEVYGAIEASLRYRTKDLSVRLQYRHIDPGYQSMGAYFLNNDLENYTVAPSFSAWKHRLRFSGSLGIQKDDLAGSKRSRSKKIIGSAALSAEITSRLGFDAGFNNYSISQMVRTIRFADSLKIVASSKQLSLSPRYIITGVNISHSILFSADLSQSKELNPVRKDSINDDIDTRNFILNYQLGFVGSHASVFISFNHTQMKGLQLTDRNSGATLGASGSWAKGKLNLSATAGYLLSKRNEEKGRIITGSMQCRWNFFARHALHLTTYYTDNTPDKVTGYYPKYTETRVEAGYGVSF